MKKYFCDWCDEETNEKMLYSIELDILHDKYIDQICIHCQDKIKKLRKQIRKEAKA